MDNAAVKTCSLPRVFPFPVEGLKIPERGFGLGNPLEMPIKPQAQPWRDQIGYAVFVHDPVTNTLTLASESEIKFFATGQGEAPASNVALPTWVQNIADTNLYPKGAPNPRDFLFAMIALGFSIGRPFALTKTEGAYDQKQSFCPWVDQYGQRARDLAYQKFGVQAVYRDSSCNVDLGTLESYPPHAGAQGGDQVRLGGGLGIMGMLPIHRGPIYVGADGESNAAQIVLKSVKQDIVLCPDEINLPSGDLAVPIHLWGYGDSGPWCGPCTTSPEEIDAMVQKRVDAALVAAGLKR